MKIKQIYDLAVALGIENDPRGTSGVAKYLKRVKKEHAELTEKQKKFFDKESFKNPFSDTRILFGDEDKTVKRALFGVDVDVSEILLADRLSEKGKKIDLVIGHHPEGSALARLDEVMDIQVDVMGSFGVPVNISENLLSERISEVKRRLNPVNHFKSVDAARLLNVPFMVIHTALDNMGHTFLSNYLTKKKDLDTVGDVLDAIEALPEFEEAKKRNAGPRITVGSPKNRIGRIAVTGFTGGTGGSKYIYERLAHAGVGTVVEMHMSDDSYTEAKKHHLNVVISGHMASDSLGANLFLDKVEKQGVEIIPTSGLIRIKRS